MAGTTVTTLAKKKMVKARAGISIAPKDGRHGFWRWRCRFGRNSKPHSADQNTLHHELLRKNVDGYEVLSDTKIRYRCTLAENELANTYISEVGLYDADGGYGGHESVSEEKERMQTWNACSSVMIHSNVFRYFVTSNRIMIDKCYHKEVENVVFRYFWSCFQQSAPRIRNF